MGIPIFFGLGVLYFGYHLFTGNHTILSYYKIEKELENTNTELDTVSAERTTMQKRVELMRTDSLDLDLLDEQSRKFLGYADENEVIIFTDE